MRFIYSADNLWDTNRRAVLVVVCIAITWFAFCGPAALVDADGFFCSVNVTVIVSTAASIFSVLAIGSSTINIRKEIKRAWPTFTAMCEVIASVDGGTHARSNAT